MQNNINSAPETQPGSEISGFKAFRKDLLSFFDVSRDLESQQVAEQEIRSGVEFKGSQLLILVFAIFVASLGLNTNSIPVIIGAMLISPLMGPIIGIGLGLGIQDFSLVNRGARNILMAVFGSLVASALYFLISPQYGDSSQLLARTSPSIYDVFIALFGGAAGIVSICCKNKGQVLPGVAIATSLMPPLCTAGYGLATLQPHFFFGALYLFFTNMLFILCASWVGVILFRFKKHDVVLTKKARRVRVVLYVIIALTIGVSVYLTVVMIRQMIFKNAADEFVKKEMVFPNTQVLTSNVYVRNGKRHIDVNLIGAYLPKDSLQREMSRKLDSAGIRNVALDIRQGFSLDSSRKAVTSDKGILTVMQAEIDSRQSKIDSLSSVISRSNYMSESLRDLGPEIRVLFPAVKDMGVSRIVELDQNGVTDTMSVVFVRSVPAMNAVDRGKLTRYLQLNFQNDGVRVVFNPAYFPWK